AGKALNYAQASVSHHLARLEAETGARLVQRSGRGVELTDAGRLLAGRAEEILGRLDAAEHELAAHVGQREERIRVAGFPSALATVVPAAAAWLRAEHPGVELLLAEAEPPTAARLRPGGAGGGAAGGGAGGRGVGLRVPGGWHTERGQQGGRGGGQGRAAARRAGAPDQPGGRRRAGLIRRGGARRLRGAPLDRWLRALPGPP